MDPDPDLYPYPNLLEMLDLDPYPDPDSMNPDPQLYLRGWLVYIFRLTLRTGVSREY